MKILLTRILLPDIHGQQGFPQALRSSNTVFQKQTMASTVAVNRLRKELSKLKKDPPPGIIAEPKESDILTWFYALQGPSETPYHGGVYVGKLKFPPEYPMKPPSILMLTPSARFQVNTRLCMSMSDFHQESWNPMWSVATILQGVVSFMASEELTTGGLKAPDSERKRLAGLSKAYNSKNFSNLFNGDMDAAFEEAEEARQLAEKAVAAQASSDNANGSGGRRRVPGPRRREKPAKSEHEENHQDHASTAEEQNQQGEGTAGNEVSEAELEKRRKKNAKKRAKQKAKKAATIADDDAGETNEGDNYGDTLEDRECG
jgi:ubiquitin-conjugating enzyme E2 J2